MANDLNVNNNRTDRWLSQSIMFFFIIQSANSSIKTIFPSLADAYGSLISALSGCLILFFIIKSMVFVLRRNRSAVFFSYFLFSIIYGVSLLLNIQRGAPVDALIKESLLWTMIWWIPMGLMVYSIYNKSILYEQMIRWSYLLSVVTMTAMVSYVTNILTLNMESLNRGNYNMFFSYMLVLPLILHLNEIVEKRYKWNVVFFIFEFFAILTNGSRGALLCVGGFLLLKFLFSDMRAEKKLRFAFITIIGVSVFYFGSQKLFEDLSDYGITSRTLEKIAGGSGTESDDRWILYGYAVDFIKERPILGYGLGGDFYEMYYKAFGTLPENTKDATLTAHNGFLQILMCFGVFFGSIVIFIFWRTLFYLPRVKNPDTKILLVILFSVFILPNFTVGDGVFVKPGIALYIYLFYNWLKNKKKLKYHPEYKYEFS